MTHLKNRRSPMAVTSISTDPLAGIVMEDDGADGDDTGEEDDDDDDDDDDDGVDETPMAAEEAARVRRALKKANEEAKKFRLEAKELREKTEDEADKAVREAREEAEAETTKVWKSRFVKAEAKSALIDAGLKQGVNRMVSLIEVDDVEVDDDGEVTGGLSEQVTALKKEFPDLFSKSKQVGGKGDTGNRREPDDAGKSKSSAERIAALVGGEE